MSGKYLGNSFSSCNYRCGFYGPKTISYKHGSVESKGAAYQNFSQVHLKVLTVVGDVVRLIADSGLWKVRLFRYSLIPIVRHTIL